MKRLIPILTAVALVTVTANAVNIYHVDGSFQGEEYTGESWLSAFPSIQEAINAASTNGGGDVWIKAGVYKPEGIGRMSTFELKPGVRLYGGFRGNETDFAQRNPKSSRTVLSGDVGRLSSPSDNSYHVITGSSDSSIDGFIVTSGNANGLEINGFGGGLLLPAGSRNVQVANCTFEKNSAILGGGIHALDASLNLTNTTFYSNSADAGGALYIANRTIIRVQDAVFSSNFAPETGGAVAIDSDVDAGFVRTSFVYNSTDGTGGALSGKTEHSDAIRLGLSDCSFSDNSARLNGGAVFASGSFSTLLSSCSFNKNFSTKGAGAVASAAKATVKLSKCTFTGNRGAKDRPDTGSDGTARVIEEAASMAYYSSMPQTIFQPAKIKPVTEPVSIAAPPPVKAKKKLEDVFVLNPTGTKVKLRSLVAAGDYTVLAFGDLTDPLFIKNYRTVEAAAIDYTPKGVNCFYVYRFLAHPENHGYIQPFSERERQQHTKIATDSLQCNVPWLTDLIDNQAAKEIAPKDRTLFIYNKEGLEEFAGTITEGDAFRRVLDSLVGKPEIQTLPDTLPEPDFEPVNLLEAELVERVKPNLRVEKLLPLQITPVESKQPHYVKARIEGTEELIKSGNGHFYLGFHIDPIYQMEWNNLGDPMRYALKVPDGSAVAPSINSATRITARATDSEPREFLLEARKLDITQPIQMNLNYSVYSVSGKRNINVTQQYIIYLEQDAFAGEAFGRQTTVKEAQKPVSDKPQQTRYDRYLINYDINRDGKISKTESFGPFRSYFDRLDTDKDNFVTREEYEAYKKKSEE